MNKELEDLQIEKLKSEKRTRIINGIFISIGVIIFVIGLIIAFTQF